MRSLVIVPCGKAKIWAANPKLGGVRAADAYVGSPFKVNRAYAEAFGTDWIILSAKYGFITPDFPIPGDYNVTFKDLGTHPITLEALMRQVEAMDLSTFDKVICLGGSDYGRAAKAAFSDTLFEVCTPLAGVSPPGVAMKRVKSAIKSKTPLC